VHARQELPKHEVVNAQEGGATGRWRDLNFGESSTSAGKNATEEDEHGVVQQYADAFDRCFVKKWGKHECEVAGCKDVLVFDGHMKVRPEGKPMDRRGCGERTRTEGGVGRAAHTCDNHRVAEDAYNV